jgi:hypothetical protein
MIYLDSILQSSLIVNILRVQSQLYRFNVSRGFTNGQGVELTGLNLVG